MKEGFLWRQGEAAHFVFGVRFPSYKRMSEAYKLCMMMAQSPAAAREYQESVHFVAESMGIEAGTEMKMCIDDGKVQGGLMEQM